MKTTLPVLVICTIATSVCTQLAEDNVVGRGAQLRLTKSGLQYLADVEVKALEKKVNNLHVPDQHGGGHHFTYDATSILIKSLRVGPHSLTTIPNVGVKLSVSGISVLASLRLHIAYEKGWVKVSDTTNVDISASGVSLAVGIKVDAVNGKPHVAVTSCSSGIGDIDLHFQGGLSWLYNLIRGMLEIKLKGILSDQMSNQGRDLINNNANKALVHFPTRMNIKDYAYIDYSLEKPVFTKEFLDFSVRGEFLSIKNPVHSKLKPPQFQTISRADKMAYIWLTDYSLNTAAEVFHSSQLLKKVIKPEDKIPPGVLPFLNTRSLKDFIPQLFAKYPDRPIRITLETFKAPEFRLRPDQAEASLYVRAVINVVLKDQTLVNVFHLDLSVHGRGIASIQTVNSQVSLGGMITSFKFKLAVGGSIIGAINLPVDNPSIQAMVRGLVVDQANPLLDKGFPLPQSNHLILKKPELTIIQNAIRVDAMVEYRL